MTYSNNAITWVFKAYRASNGKSEVCDWYDELPGKERAKFRSRRLEYLVHAPPQNWKDPHYHTLTGEYAGESLGEIRTKINNVQWRIIGFSGPGQWEFTALLVVKEKDKKLPKSTFTKAKKRKNEIQLNGDRAHVWDF